MQADGQRDLEHGTNRGDGGDPYPGHVEQPGLHRHLEPELEVLRRRGHVRLDHRHQRLRPVMTAQVQVQCGKSAKKDLKDVKDSRKEVKDAEKLWAKDRIKDRIKDVLIDKRFDVDKRHDLDKRPEKPDIDKRTGFDKPGDQKLTDGKFRDGKLADGRFGAPAAGGPADAFEDRLALLEAVVFGTDAPFIGDDLRPDLREAALQGEPDVGGGGTIPDKRAFDSKSPEGT